MSNNTSGSLQTGKRGKIVRGMWTVFFIFILLSALIFFLIVKGFIGYMPPVADLENPIDKYATQVISSDNVTLGTYAQNKENRIYSKYTDLSPFLVEALISTEDARFEEHSGIDAYALLRSFVKRGLLFQKSGGGGSTITQQLAKQLYSPTATNVIERMLQKPIEWVIAVQLEKYYTKEEIVNMYLNEFDFLYNAVGIQSAAWVYFGKFPKELNVQEAATLIGMCKNPSYYNPLRQVERTVGRRNVVLDLMCRNGYLTSEQCDSVKALPLLTNFHRLDHKEGLAPYFREYLRMIMTATKPNRKMYAAWQRSQYSSDSLMWENNPLYGWCNKNKKANGSHYNLYTDGLKIYTTIDSHMQAYAEASVNEHLGGFLQNLFNREKRHQRYFPYSSDVKYGQIVGMLKRTMQQSDRYRTLKSEGMSDEDIDRVFNTKTDMTVFTWGGLKDTVMTPMDSIKYMKTFLRAGFFAMDPHTGAVKAYVGGPNFNYFQYDMVNLGRRQIGSTIKPFLYSLAMENGFTPCSEMLHVPQQLIDANGVVYSPRNSNKKNIGDMVSFRWGLQNSDNWVTAYIMKQFSPYPFVKLLHSFGLQGYIDPVVSLCLGPCDATLAEMVSGYSAFVNGGIKVNPLYVTRIEDSFGNVLATFNTQSSEVISEDASYKMLDMLRAVIDGGTGGRIRYHSRHNIHAPMGGKTGTSQNNSDGWFIAFTPRLLVGSWVGGEDRSIHFDNPYDGQAANTALPVVGIFMNKIFRDTSLGYKQTEDFKVPLQYQNTCASVGSPAPKDSIVVNGNQPSAVQKSNPSKPEKGKPVRQKTNKAERERGLDKSFE